MLDVTASRDGASRAHDVRGQATSAALFRGASVDDFCWAAYWKSPSTLIRAYLSDVLESGARFATAALRVASA